MRQIRRFQYLTIGDNYMFGAVMMENDNCRQLLERVLEMPISRVEVIKENRGKERQYMMWQDIIDDAKEEGRQDMREPMVAMLKGMLSRFGTLPDEVVRRIDQETDMDKITVWAQLVVKVKSLEDFVDQM